MSVKRSLITAPAGIEEISEFGSVYPNPFTTKATIRFEKPALNARLELYNSLGQKVRDYLLISGNELEISIEQMNNGVYFLMGQDDS